MQFRFDNNGDDMRHAEGHSQGQYVESPFRPRDGLHGVCTTPPRFPHLHPILAA